jgi:tetratricopeptide (TPR) repeat protein
MFIGRAETNAASREIDQAEYELETFKGLLEMARGQFLEAQAHFKVARQLAQSLDDEKGCAKSNKYLAMAFGNYGDIGEAHEHARLAMDYFQRVGDRLQIEGLRAELAGYYLNGGRFAEVIEPAEQALAFFENIQHQQWIGYLCSNLAEAYFETGQMETAEGYANRALSSGNPRVQPYVYYTLGLVYQSKNELSQAGQYFQEGIDLAEQAEERFIAAYLYRAFGRMLLEIGSNEGQHKIKQAVKLFSNLAMEHEIDKTHELL